MHKNDSNQSEQNKHGDRKSDHDGKRGGNHTPATPPARHADLSPKESEAPAKPQQKA